MKTLFVPLIVALTQTSSFAQSVSINWSKSLGGVLSEEGFSVCQGLDSSYLVAGYTYSNDGDVTEWFGGFDIWLVNLSQEGVINWQRSIGGTQQEQAYCIIPTHDNCYVICGYSSSSDGNIEINYGSNDCFFMKVDAVGNILWQLNLGGLNSEFAKSIIQTFDGGYMFTGYSRSDDGPFIGHFGDTEYSDLIVGKIDASGNLVWLKNIGGAYSEEGNALIETADSNYIVVGQREVIENEFDYYLVKVTDDGEVLWTKSYGGSNSDALRTVLEFKSNNFLVSGYCYSEDGDVVGSHGSGDAWTLLVDGNGEILWSRSYGGSGPDIWYSGLKIDENTICFCGTTGSEDGDVVGYEGSSSYPNYWIVALDSLGIIKWQGCFGGSGTDQCLAFDYTFEHNFILTGTTFSNDGDVIGYHDDGGPESPKDAWTLQVSVSCDPMQYYLDFDGDNFGDAANYIYSCTDTTGYVLDKTDCNDTLSTIYPGAIEFCNYLDDDCDGLIDESFAYLHSYQDADNDNFGNPFIDSLSCELPTGYVADSTDCDDTNPDIYPGAVEVLNGLDDDCDQTADEGLPINELQVEQFSLYPNPAFNTIQINSNFSEVGIFTVYTSTGQKVISGIWDSGTLAISILKLVSGIYLLNLHSDDINYNGTFIKL